MKQSDDQNTITLDDGRTFESVKMTAENGCKSCDFSKSDLVNYCWNVFCIGFEREDGRSVYFMEVKNVKTEKKI